jgi:hypothetical protein
MDLMDTINQSKRIKRTGLSGTVKGRREPRRLITRSGRTYRQVYRGKTLQEG